MGGSPSCILSAPALWHGGADVLSRRAFFQDNSIKHVVSVCNFAPNFQGSAELTATQVDINDEPEAQLLPHLPRLVRFIHEARSNGENVYVHCAAGISRSTTVVCAYIMAWAAVDVSIALRAIRRSRSCARPNPGFMRQLSLFQTIAGEHGCIALREHFSSLCANNESLNQLRLQDMKYVMQKADEQLDIEKLNPGVRPFGYYDGRDIGDDDEECEESESALYGHGSEQDVSLTVVSGSDSDSSSACASSGVPSQAVVVPAVTALIEVEQPHVHAAAASSSE